ncbi:hypothetical protein TNCV_1644551 [Trichonephila clavipes]|nr:hypothetical protein TNCV_1644551 [Trichonephila clavipes]
MNEPPSQYGGYDPRLVTEWVWVQNPRKRSPVLFIRDSLRSLNPRHHSQVLSIQGRLSRLLKNPFKTPGAGPQLAPRPFSLAGHKSLAQHP